MVVIHIDGSRTFEGECKSKTDQQLGVSGTDKERYLQRTGILLLQGTLEAFAEFPCEAELVLEVAAGRVSLSGTVVCASAPIHNIVQEVVEAIDQRARQFVNAYPKASASIRYHQEILE